MKDITEMDAQVWYYLSYWLSQALHNRHYPFPHTTNLLDIKKVENNVAKAEIAHEQILYLPQCFQMFLAAEVATNIYMQKRINSSSEIVS